ncbi:MAG: T9SS C-terminal target domain-containing protein [Candidatus Zixiibacteriota bacterium]|nr:MAG: T9SS C-terminal target domain-containing protein [candidate division Zixibacteria bacterium]
MKKSLWISLLAVGGLGLAAGAGAQPPDTLWTRTFGGSSYDYGSSVEQTTDGGYIIAGYTWSFGLGYHDVYLVKTDAEGNPVWQRTFGGSYYDYGYSVQQTTDGGYVIAGETWPYGAGSYNVYLVKTDASGNPLWQQAFGGSSGDFGRSVQQTADGGYVIAGETWSCGAGSWDVYLIKTEAGGQPLETTLTPVNPPLVIPATGGSFDYQVRIQNLSGLTQEFQVWSGWYSPDGNWIGILGPFRLTNVPVGADLTFGRAQNVAGTNPPGEYTYVGYAGIYASGSIWDSSYFTFTKSATDGSGAFVYNNENWGDPFPGEPGGPPPRATAWRFVVAEEFTLSVYPNPFNPVTTLRFGLPAAGYVRLEVFDTGGRNVGAILCGRPGGGHIGPPLQGEAWYPAGSHEVSFDGTGLPSGVYLVRLTAGEVSQVQKIVLLK